MDCKERRCLPHLRRNEPPDLLHERDVLGHRVPGLRERRIPWLYAHVPRLEAAGEAAGAVEAAGVEPAVLETRRGLELHAGRRGGLLRAAGQAADRGANGPGASQGDGAYANGSGEAEAEAEPHHRNGAMQSGKGERKVVSVCEPCFNRLRMILLSLGKIES